MSAGTDLYSKDRKQSTPNNDMKYILEVDGKCPICGNYLIKDKGKRTNKLFQIAHIYPNSPTIWEIKELEGLERLGKDSEDFENKIALCKDCHGYYDDHKTKEEYLKLLGIKKNLLDSIETKKILSNQPIEDCISSVLNALSNVSGEMIKLEVNALKISEKIENAHLLLRHKVEMYVTQYFKFIQEQFKVLSIQEKLNFDIVASQIRTAFLQAEENLDDKNDMFNQLTKWLQSKTHGSSIEACEAVISFFIQDCEVFREITE